MCISDSRSEKRSRKLFKGTGEKVKSQYFPYSDITAQRVPGDPIPQIGGLIGGVGRRKQNGYPVAKGSKCFNFSFNIGWEKA